MHVFLSQCLLFSLVTIHFRVLTFFFKITYDLGYPTNICFPPNILYNFSLVPNRASALPILVSSVSYRYNNHMAYSNNNLTYNPNAWISVVLPAYDSCDLWHFFRKVPELKIIFLKSGNYFLCIGLW